jgi:hypothetical protein
MELRTTEEKIDELIQLYTSVRNAKEDGKAMTTDEQQQQQQQQPPQLHQYLPDVPRRALVNNETTTTTTTASNAASSEVPSVVNSELLDSTTSSTSIIMTLAEILSNLQRLQSDIVTLQPKLIRFRQRLGEKDSVTGKQRYGEKTQVRVQNLVAAYDILAGALHIEQQQQAAGAADSLTANSTAAASTTTTANANDTPGDTPWILNQLQQRLQQEEAQAERQRQEAAKQQLEAQVELERIEQQARFEQEQQQLALETQRAEEEAAAQAAVRQRAEQVRQERLAAQDAERSWIASIQVNRDGVQEQLQVLLDSTQSDPVAQKLALSSLLRLFQQINAHPEEPNFRRIRRDHEQFNRDIGRHKGGKEVLLAAGFELGAIDDVPCFISKEPDLEHDMDGWSAWFDLLKATLQILEQYQ